MRIITGSLLLLGLYQLLQIALIQVRMEKRIPSLQVTYFAGAALRIVDISSSPPFPPYILEPPYSTAVFVFTETIGCGGVAGWFAPVDGGFVGPGWSEVSGVEVIGDAGCIDLVFDGAIVSRGRGTLRVAQANIFILGQHDKFITLFSPTAKINEMDT